VVVIGVGIGIGIVIGLRRIQFDARDSGMVFLSSCLVVVVVVLVLVVDARTGQTSISFAEGAAVATALGG
jgi:hypothetical protein